VVLAFGLYRGGNRYDLAFESFSDGLHIPRAERAQALSALIRRYATRLEHYARLAPYNWFNFYDFWNDPAAQPLDAPLSAPAARTLAMLLIVAGPLCAAPDPGAVDTGWILSHLARPAPTRTQFVELRDSKLLKAPLRIEGEYRRPVDDTLVREVRAPYAETTTIASGNVSIARAGKTPRNFSLSRVPELAGLQASFGALLSGIANCSNGITASPAQARARIGR
jgi:hypothetical protein